MPQKPPLSVALSMIAAGLVIGFAGWVVYVTCSHGPQQVLDAWGQWLLAVTEMQARTILGGVILGGLVGGTGLLRLSRRSLANLSDSMSAGLYRSPPVIGTLPTGELSSPRNRVALERELAATNQALQASQSQLSNILDSAIAAIINFRIYPDTSIQYDYISPQCEAIFGYTAAELMANPEVWRSRIHPTDWEQVLVPAFETLMPEASPVQQTVEYRFQRQDGSTVWILEKCLARWDSTAGYWQATVVDTDISDRKATEAALHNLLAGTATVLGQDFFPALVKHLAEALGVTGAMVTEQIENTTLQTLGIWIDGAFQPNVTYDATSTPCERVLQDGYCYCEQAVSRLAIADLDLAAMGIGCYLGVALRNHQGHIIGGICILNQEPMSAPQQVTQLLTIFANRAAAELERQRANTALEQLNQHLEAEVTRRTAELRQQEAHYRALVDVIPDLLVHLHMDGTYLDVIPGEQVTLCNTLQTRPEMNIYDALPGPYAQQRMDYARRAVETQTVQRYEYELPVDGEVRSEEARIVAINEDEVLVIVRDITDRKQTELALQQSEARLTNLLDSLGAVINQVRVYDNADWDIEYLSGGFERLFGNPPDDLAANKDLWLAGISPEQWETIMIPAFGKIFREEDYLIEYEFHRVDGTRPWIAQYCTPRRDETNETWVVSSVAIDVSERKRLELALQASEQTLSDILNNALASITSFRLYADGTCHHDYWSEGCAQVFGFTAAELMADQTLWRSRIEPTDFETIVLPSLEHVFAEKPHSREYRFYDNVGALRWISSRLVPRRDDARNCWVVIAVDVDITERKLIETALAASEARSQAILAAIPDLMFQVGADGIYQDVIKGNSELEMFFEGRSPIGLSMHEVLPEAMAARQARYLEQALHTGQVQRYEQQIHQGERHRDEEVRVVKCGDDQALFIIRDISDRKHAEQALQDSEERYRAIFDQVAVGINQADARGYFISANQAFCDMVGYTRAELQRLTYQSLTHPEDLFKQYPIHKRLMAGQIPLSIFEKRYRHKNGHYVWAQIAISALRDRTGHIVSDLAVVVNIDDKKRTEAALQAKTEELDRFFSAALDLLCIADTDGYFHRLNPQWERTLGYPLSELEGTRFLDYVHPEDLRSTLGAIAKLRQRVDVPSFVNRYRCVDGTYRWLEWCSLPVDNKIYAAARDITDRKQAELTLHQLSQELMEWRDRYDIAALASGQVLFEHDLITDQDTWGPNTEAILGYPPEAMPQGMEDYISHIHPDDRASFRQLLAEERQQISSTPHQLEFRFRKADGTYLWVEERSMTRYDPEGEAIQVIGYVIDISDRKQAEAALKQSELTNLTIIETIPDLLIQMDRTGQYRRMVGGQGVHVEYPSSSTSEPDLFDVLPRDLAEERLRYTHQAIETGSLQVYEQIFVVDDKECHEEVRIAPLNQQDVLVIVRDITDRKLAEAQLRRLNRELDATVKERTAEIQEREARYRALVELIPDLLIRMRADGTYLDVIPGDSIELLNPQHTGPGANIYAILPESFAQQRMEQVQRALQTQMVQVYDYDLMIDGMLRSEEARIIASSQSEVLVIVRDITERKQAEQTIREQAALLDIASDAIIVRGLDQQILYWNQGAERLYGWPATRAIGQNARILFNNQVAQHQTIMQHLLDHGAWQGELHKTTQAGTTVIVEARWTLVRDHANQPKSILSVDTDVTEQKRLEADFYRAQRLDSLGRLASGIAHDLNNVFTPILTMTQLLRFTQGSLTATGREHLQLLEVSARRGADLVKQILTFVQGSSEELVPVDLNALLQEVVEIVQQSLPASIDIGLQLSADVLAASPDLIICADPIHLHQIFMNLCINARDAMPEGGMLTLSIQHYRVDEAIAHTHPDAQLGEYAVVTVADTGTGITPEVCDRMFDPFFTTKETGKGSGLGLSTVLGIVKNYGGFLQVSTEVGGGTQMRVYLPTTDATPMVPTATTRQLAGAGELVLIVDDDIAVQQTTRSLLENHDYQTITADNGQAALTMYREHQADISLVIVDVMMPDMDGITLVGHLRAIDQAVPIVAISGLPANRTPVLAAGANRFLSKPYVLEHLLQQVWTLINGSSTDHDLRGE